MVTPSEAASHVVSSQHTACDALALRDPVVPRTKQTKQRSE